jgi:iron complex outermembrane recepter protein
MLKKLPLVSALALALPITVGSNSALAQLLLEEVIVTAQKRTESLQDVPISITAVSGEKIDDIGITELEEITQYMPNVTINTGAGTPNLFVRGVGSGTNAGFEQSVGMYIDGVYAGRGALAAVPTTMDLERVEILKGPQGILFGKNTVAGAINITTAKPTDEFEGMVEALYEHDHGEQQYNVVLSGPLSDTLSGRLAVRHNQMDGWWENTVTGSEGRDDDIWYGRGSLRWQPTDTLEVNAKYEKGDFDRRSRPVYVYQSDFTGQQNSLGSVPFPVVGDRDRGAGDVDGRSVVETDVLAITVDWELDFATFTSISAYSSYDSDGDPGNTDLTATPALTRAKFEEYDQYSQEIRFVSPGGETIDWIAGAYYQQGELDISSQVVAIDFAQSGPISVPPLYSMGPEPGVPGIFDQDSDSWAIFGSGTWNATDALRFTLGLRYNEETKDLDKQTFADGLGFRVGDSLLLTAGGLLIADLRQHEFRGLSRDEEKWTYSANVQWDVGDDTMLYASVSTGFKGGGYDEAYSSEGEEIRLADANGVPTGEVVQTGTDASILEYEDEEVLSYEIGAKMGLLDGAAELNVAVFRMEYENLQTSSLIGDVFRVGNAGESISQGVEIDGRWLVTEGLTLGGAVAYLDAYYDDFTGATCTIKQTTDPVNHPGCLLPDGTNIAPGQSGGQDLTDETLTYAPDWSANINARFVMPLGENLMLINTVDINYEDEFYSALDLDPETKHDDATIINARIALASADRDWSVALIGKNLTDEKTSIWNQDVPFTNSNSYFALPNRPRSIALQARYRF